jgi:hypothetical protein
MEWPGPAAQARVAHHFDRTVAAINDELLICAAGDTWARSMLIGRRHRLVSLREELATGQPPSSDYPYRMALDDFFFDLLLRRRRWKKPPLGTRYVKFLDASQRTELRWYNWILWLRFWWLLRRHKQLERAAVQGDGTSVAA